MDCHADKSARNDKATEAMDCHALPCGKSRNDKQNAFLRHCEAMKSPKQSISKKLDLLTRLMVIFYNLLYFVSSMIIKEVERGRYDCNKL